MKTLRKGLSLFVILAILMIALPALSTSSQTGGQVVNFGNIKAYSPSLTFTDNDATVVAKLPLTWGKPTVFVSTNAQPYTISCDLDNYVEFGDGSTVAPDGDGLGTHAGLNDPEFEWVGGGSPTSAFMIECVVVAAGTFKSRITGTSSVDPIHEFGTWGDYETTIAIPTTHYDMGAGVGLEWAAAGGHTIGDTWYIQIYPDDEFDGSSAGSLSVTRADLDGTVIAQPLFFWLDAAIAW